MEGSQPSPATSRLALLVAIAVWGLVSGHRLAAQALQVKLEDFGEQEISVWAQPEHRGGWGEEQELGTYKRGRSFSRYQVYYGYNESALTPRSSENCYLHLFIVDPRLAGGTAGTTRAWYERYRLNVEGDFIDRNVDLVLSIVSDGSVDRGTIRVTAHRDWPDKLLQPKHADVPTIDVWTNATKHEGATIEFANRSRCCEVHFLDGTIVQGDKDLLGTPEVTAMNKVLQPQGEGAFQEWLSLALEPSPLRAFWKSFSFFGGEDPESELTVKVTFVVQGGKEADFFQKVRVRFKPPWPLVVFSVALGASLSSSVSLLLAKRRRGMRPLFPSQPTQWGKTGEVLKRLLVSVLVAVVVYFAYFLIKGNKDVILFNFPLEPSQCLPAFLIGLLVGTRPEFYFDSFFKGGQGKGKAVLLALALLGTAGPLSAQPQKLTLRPVDLDYDAASDSLYVLDSLSNRILRLSPSKYTLQEIGRVDRAGTATSQCLVRWNDLNWVATLSRRRIGSSGFWRVELTLTAIGRKQVIPKTFSGNWEFQAIDFDAAHQRLLVLDFTRGAIFAIPLLAKGLGEPVMLVRNAWLSQGSAIVIRGDDVFATVRGRRALIRVNLKTGDVEPLVQDLSDPADVTLTPDGTRLLVADAGQGRILEYDLKGGTTKELVGGSSLREPRAVQLDRHGNLWVADAWHGAVLQFSPKGGPPLRKVR